MPDEPSTREVASSDLAALQRKILRFAAARDWQQFHDPKNLAMALGVEVGELMEHFRWLRSGEALAALSDPRTRSEVEDEIADVTILLLEFASVCGIDIIAAADRKLARNEERYPVTLSRGSAKKHTRLGE